MKKKISLLLATMMLFAVMQVGVWAKPNKNIVEIATSDPQFSTLVTALQAAGLVDTLQGEGPFTVFAPTNEAFAKLPAGTLNTLLKPENKQMLVDILTYHVTSGKVSAQDVAKLNGKEIKMVNGKPVKITVKDGKVYINNAQVTKTDIMAKNGVIHVIDTVILPPQQ
ncbi:MAG: fasciclin domain-containing protein [Cellulosilyticaceae bacterium]